MRRLYEWNLGRSRNPAEGEEFIYGSMNRGEFRFVHILDWVRQHIKPLV